jgi:hypothetical protein
VSDGFVNTAAGTYIVKDPGAILTYGLALEDWLNGETLASATWTVPAGITKVSESLNSLPITSGARTYSANTCALVRLSGGSASTDYSLVCHWVTSGGDEDERTIIIRVRQR